MRFSATALILGTLTAVSISLSGCAAQTDTTAAAPGASSPSVSASDLPASTAPTGVAPTTAQTSDPNMQVSLLDERAFTGALKPLGFACDASVVKAIDVSGSQVEFSTIACRRGSEPAVVLTLAANQNELELVTSQSCKGITGTQARTPIVAGGNWQLLSAVGDRPLLAELGKILQGKTITIAQLCA